MKEFLFFMYYHSFKLSQVIKKSKIDLIVLVDNNTIIDESVKDFIYDDIVLVYKSKVKLFMYIEKFS